jgi:hypothetical protein
MRTVFHEGAEWFVKGLDRHIDIARERLREQPTIDAAPRWISVKERLPEEGQIVAFIPSCNHESVYVGVLSNIGKSGGVMFSHREGRYKSNYYAKYWMPLPEPPKEEQAT